MKNESYENSKELDAELEHALDEIEKMDFTDVSNPINIQKPVQPMWIKFSEETTVRNHILTIHEGIHFRLLNGLEIDFELRPYIECVYGGKKYYKCCTCNPCFYDISDLRSHMVAVHESNKNPNKNLYKCVSCDSLFMKNYI